MSNAELLAVITSIGALVLALYAAIRSHVKPVQLLDTAIVTATADPTLTHYADLLAQSLPPDTLKLLRDAGLLIEKITEPPAAST